jgi:hypothetical protein
MPKAAAARAPKPLATRQRYRAPARALSPGSIVNLRNEIRCKNLIHRLQLFALDDPDNPTGPRLTRTQAQVALALLKKALPDMQTLEISGNQDQPITVQILRFADPSADGLSLQDESNAAAHVAHLNEPLTIDLQPDAFEAQIEANPRLIEDEPPERSQRMTRKRKPNQ